MPRDVSGRFYWYTRGDYSAYCVDCGVEYESRNAFGLAVQHHDRTGHRVHIQTTRVVAYEKKEAYDARKGE